MRGRVVAGEAGQVIGTLPAYDASRQTSKDFSMTAYLIVDVEVIDAPAYEEYRKQVPAIIAAHGGRYLVRGGASEVLEGTWHPHRSVVLEFPSMAAIKAFWTSAEYQPLRALRERAARSSLVAVEGIG
jgi:uncharacterized protein (DUF1330 family)